MRIFRAYPEHGCDYSRLDTVLLTCTAFHACAAASLLLARLPDPERQRVGVVRQHLHQDAASHDRLRAASV